MVGALKRVKNIKNTPGRRARRGAPTGEGHRLSDGKYQNQGAQNGPLPAAFGGPWNTCGEGVKNPSNPFKVVSPKFVVRGSQLGKLKPPSKHPNPHAVQQKPLRKLVGSTGSGNDKTWGGGGPQKLGHTPQTKKKKGRAASQEKIALNLRKRKKKLVRGPPLGSWLRITLHPKNKRRKSKKNFAVTKWSPWERGKKRVGRKMVRKTTRPPCRRVRVYPKPPPKKGGQTKNPKHGPIRAVRTKKATEKKKIKNKPKGAGHLNWKKKKQVLESVAPQNATNQGEQ